MLRFQQQLLHMTVNDHRCF